MTEAAASNGYISRGNMTVLLSAVGLVMLALGGFITFQNNNTDRRISEIRDDLRKLEDKALTKEEHREFKEHTASDIQRLEKGIVPRPEVESNAAKTTASIEALSNRYTEVRASLAAITTPQSQFTRMENDIVELRKQLNETRKSP